MFRTALRSNPPDRKARELWCGFQPEFFFDVRAMHVHGFRAEMETAGDFVGAPAFTIKL